MNAPISLDRAPLGTPLTLLSTHPDVDVAHRLTSLGMRRGVRVQLVQKLASGGRIVSVAGGRVAVDQRILAGLEAEVAE